MSLGPHALFIVIAYAVAVGIVAAMILWVVLDRRRQMRILSDLETKGVTRRSARTDETASAKE